MGKKQAPLTSCYCGLSQPFEQCCGAIIKGTNKAVTAEQLMRSRYSAFVTHEKAYLLATWHPDQRPTELDFDPLQQWIGLKIVRTEAGQAHDSHGLVEFIARYKIQGKAYRLQETSQFQQHHGQWFYTHGDIHEA